MSQRWNREEAPTFVKVVDGELVRLNLGLPEFDGTTKGLHDLSTKELVEAGWYTAQCDPPVLFEDVLALPVVFYSLISANKKTGVAELSIQQDLTRPEKKLLRKAAYEKESDALVIRAMRLQLLNDTSTAGKKALADARDEALAKIAEIKTRYPE